MPKTGLFCKGRTLKGDTYEEGRRLRKNDSGLSGGRYYVSGYYNGVTGCGGLSSGNSRRSDNWGVSIDDVATDISVVKNENVLDTDSIDDESNDKTNELLLNDEYKNLCVNI